MKKLIATSLVILASCFFAASAAKADYIYFLVDSYNPEGDTSLNFAFARIGVAQDGEAVWQGDAKTFLDIKTEDGVGTAIDATESYGAYVRTGEGFAIVDDYEDKDGGYTFYVETYDENGKILWTYDESSAKSFADLASDKHIVYGDSISEPDAVLWNVPEPSSGLLVLFGLAGLALKRRRTGLPSRVSHEVRT